MKDQPLFAWAGLWRKSVEWGDVYAGVMTDCNEAIRPVHNRMPVLLHVDDHEQWLHGDLDDVLALQDRCFPNTMMTMERTSELWVKRQSVPLILMSAKGGKRTLAALSECPLLADSGLSAIGPTVAKPAVYFDYVVRPISTDCVEKVGWWPGRADFVGIAKTRIEQYQ